MTDLLSSVRYSARRLMRDPGTNGLAIFALALGIGLTTIMFSIIYGGIIKGLPYDGADRMLHLERSNLAAGIESMEVPIHDFEDWRAAQRSFEEFAAYYSGTVNIAGTERADRFNGAFITASGLRMLGIQPERGRLFLDEETRPGAPRTIILGYGVWRDRFGLDEAVVGQILRVNSEPTTVIGVMPEGFAFPLNEEAWLGLPLDAATLPREAPGTTLEVFGLLREGVTLDQAHEDLSSIARRLEEEHPETNEGVGVLIQPFEEEYVGEEPRALLSTMLLAVFLVLLIACANVANLLLARISSRAKEIGIRSAIGASRGQVVTQMLTESVILALAGGVLGTAIAYWGIAVFRRAILVSQPPFWMEFGLLPPVLGMVIILTLFAGLAAGFVPAWKASGADVNAILKDETRGTSSLAMGRLARVLVVAEIALSVGLLVSAGLTARSVSNLRSTDFGFVSEGVFTGRVGVFESAYPDVESRHQYFEQLREELAQIPEVETVALGTELPGVSACCWTFGPEGVEYDRDQDYPNAPRIAVSPGYFETFGIPLVSGRVIEARDGATDLPVVVVNQLFEREFFPEGALGKRIRMGASGSTQPLLTVVGVVGDAYMAGIGDNDEPNRPGLYIATAQTDNRFLSVGVRVRGGGAATSVTSAVRDAAARVDPDTPVYWAMSLDDAIRQNTWFYTIFGTLFMLFGAAALFLASVGLYGVMAFSGAQRTQEVGIRIALGARPGDVVRMMVRQGTGQIAVGVVLGLGLAVLLSRGLELILFGVNPNDPLAYIVVVILLAATGLLATFVPARKASRTDPMVAFRYE